MLPRKLLISIYFVFFSCFVYVNADLNLQDNLLDETIYSQKDILTDIFEDEKSHPPQQASSCICRGGTCVTEGGKEVCKCPPGFGNFTANSCKECNCGPGMECYWGSGFGGKICLCKPGYYIESSKCVDCECGFAALTCEFVSQGWLKSDKKVCKCQPGAKEQDGKCVGPCSANPCKNDGACLVEGLNFKCKCKEPYSGKTCEEDPCTSKPCLNSGNCTIKDKGFLCKCPDPFFGDKCEKNPCSPNPCGNGGKCKTKGKSFTCDCPSSFVGETCQYQCDCENGKCRVSSSNEVVCECLPEYGKKSNVCTACDCGTGANCTFESSWMGFKTTKYCLCPDGSKLEEKHCEDPCNSNPCLNNGKCKADGKSFKCECKGPYSGPTCKEDPCSDVPCKNGGTCQIYKNTFQCRCPKPFGGKSCEEDPCTNNPCQGRGTCSLNGNTFKCNCTKPYFGDKCEKECDCENGKCRVSSSNEVVCECLPEYGKKSDVCTACDCGTGANCTFESSWMGFKTTKYCLCPDGSKLEEKHCEDIHDFELC